MTPDMYLEIANDKINQTYQQILNRKKLLERIILSAYAIQIAWLIIGFTIIKNIHIIETISIISAVIIGILVYAYLFSIYAIGRTPEQKFAQEYAYLHKTYKYVKYKQFWIFYNPKLRSTYYFLDHDFNPIIRDLHLKRSFQKSINYTLNELTYTVPGETVNTENLDALIHEINITDEN